MSTPATKMNLFKSFQSRNNFKVCARSVGSPMGPSKIKDKSSRVFSEVAETALIAPCATRAQMMINPQFYEET